MTIRNMAKIIMTTLALPLVVLTCQNIPCNAFVVPKTTWSMPCAFCSRISQDGRTNSKAQAITTSTTKRSRTRTRTRTRPTSTSLGMNDFFDSLGKLFGEGSSSEEESVVGKNGESPVFTIPVKSIKTGGLRLALTLHLMGQQNTPHKNSWKANQSADGVLDMYYCDQTGAVTIAFHNDRIAVARRGPSPSLQFMMEESALLHGVLDELDDMVSEGDVKEDDRLVVLHAPGDAIEKARERLAFS